MRLMRHDERQSRDRQAEGDAGEKRERDCQCGKLRIVSRSGHGVLSNPTIMPANSRTRSPRWSRRTATSSRRGDCPRRLPDRGCARRPHRAI